MEVIFILVEPAVPENIGAAARALKTMGFTKLRLVNPHGFPNEKAFHVAHGSGEILEQAILCNSLDEALRDLDFSVATSAKRRAVRYDYLRGAELPDLFASKMRSVRKAAIVFGREESGLSNAEIGLCDVVSFLPMKRKYPSLNLAQAVMLYAYLLSPYAGTRNKGTRTADPGKYRRMKLMAHQTLDEIRFRKDSNIYSRIFERLALLGDDDVNLVLSFLDKLGKSRKDGR